MEFKSWKNPNKNCGACGESSCENFMKSLQAGRKTESDCPFSSNNVYIGHADEANYEESDTHGHVFDFLLKPVGNEISARKIIKPFRVDLIDRLAIKKGDYVMGRPMGAGCPVTHVLEVYEVDELSGVLYTWAVGPKMAREGHVKEIKSYSMVGFEGIADNIKNEPLVGKGAGFMPSFCMLRLTHYGLVNMVLDTKEGLLVRIEDIHIANVKG